MLAVLVVGMLEVIETLVIEVEPLVVGEFVELVDDAVVEVLVSIVVVGFVDVLLEVVWVVLAKVVGLVDVMAELDALVGNVLVIVEVMLEVETNDEVVVGKGELVALLEIEVSVVGLLEVVADAVVDAEGV